MVEQSKNVLYVGGLVESVAEETLHAAFIPFGDISQVNLPKDSEKKNRGFAFIEFDDENDAEEACFNMNGAELFGRFLRVSVAKPESHDSAKPVWSADSWFQNLQQGDLVENQQEKRPPLAPTTTSAK